MAHILDGKQLSQNLIAKVKIKTNDLFEQKNIRPGLAVILLGEDIASHIYVNAKQKLALDCQFYSRQFKLPYETTQQALLELINELNKDDTIHGILIQLPLPQHIDKAAITQAIHPHKDVDGFHYNNVGKLAMGDFQHSFVPCTPAGIMLMINHYITKDLTGINAVIIGRSNLVGRPMAQLLLDFDATVTITHRKTKSLKMLCQQADLIIAAAGSPLLVKGDWVKKNSAVIDVGINRVNIQKEGQESYKIVGDVDFEAVKNIAKYISPVPGGVGPMTIAMLMTNTLNAACYQHDMAPLKFLTQKL